MEKEKEDALKKIYEKFCDKNEMQYFQFSLFCQKYNLIDNKFNLKNIDNLFSQIKTAKKRTINFSQFEMALKEISKIKGKNIINMILKKNKSAQNDKNKNVNTKKEEKETEKIEEENTKKKIEILERQQKLRINKDNEEKSEDNVRRYMLLR